MSVALNILHPLKVFNNKIGFESSRVISMDLFCVGLNYKGCPVATREKLAFTEANISPALEALKKQEGIQEGFILSTCNRVEIYARGFNDIESVLIEFISEFHRLNQSEFCSFLYQYRGEEAVRHLFSVSCGLDSMVIGENEIHGQIRRAFRLANDFKTIESVLYQLIERAIRVGKKVRKATKINEGAVSVSSVAVELAGKIFGQLSNEKVLVLGAGEMSELTLERLVSAGVEDITVSSRTYERALEVSQKFGATPVRFNEWFHVLRSSDIVISSTAALRPLISYKDVKNMMLDRKDKPLFFIDIAVPRDIDAQVDEIDDVYLYNIDDLRAVSETNLKLRKKEVLKCEKIIEHEVELFRQWEIYFEARNVIQKFVSYFDGVIDEEFLKLENKFERKEDEWYALAGRIKSKLLHTPLEKLKENAKEGNIDRYLEVLDSLFRLEKTRISKSEVESSVDLGTEIEPSLKDEITH